MAPDTQHIGQRGDALEPALLGRDANACVGAGVSNDLRAERSKQPVQDRQVRARGCAEHGEGKVAPGPCCLIEQDAGGRCGVEPIRARARLGLAAGRARGALHAPAVRAERIAIRHLDRAGIGFCGRGSVAGPAGRLRTRLAAPPRAAIRRRFGSPRTCAALCGPEPPAPPRTARPVRERGSATSTGG